jgi:hypothetical protein
MSKLNDVISMMKSTGEESSLVDQLINLYVDYKSSRSRWEAENDEVSKFVFATDTRSTVQQSAEFKNTTTIPKLAQVRNNIITSYEEHLFPNSDWVQWDAVSQEATLKEKADIVKAYVATKAADSNLKGITSLLVQDWTDRGFCAAEVYFCNEMNEDVEGNKVQGYYGARAKRLNPNDVFYDVLATDLEHATKVVRSVYSLGGLKKLSTENPEVLSVEAFDRIRTRRHELANALVDANGRETYISKQLHRAGFGDMVEYLLGDKYELLTFYGNFYDEDNDILYDNHRIQVLDRQMILKKEPITSMTGKHNVFLGVWEFREGTLAPIGPLHRIVGLQYKLDKLENQRADKFDQLINPTIVEIGDVEFYGVRGKPGGRYKVEDGGDVKELVESGIVLQADTQIQFTLALMDELSGNPKESIGQRTPGEKTKFEVQLLDSGQNKMFRNKVKKFEDEVLTPMLQEFLSVGRRNLNQTDLVKVYDAEMDTFTFHQVTRDDLNISGRLRAAGATIFAERANALQNLATLSNTNLMALTNQHWSRIKLAKTIEDLSGLKQYELVFPNIGIQEDEQTKRLAQHSQDKTTENALTGEDATNGPEATTLE